MPKIISKALIASLVAAVLLPSYAAKNDLDPGFYYSYAAGVKQEKLGNTLQAARLFKESANTNPSDYDTLVKLGLLHLNSDADGDFRITSNKLAFDYLSKAMQIRTDDAMVALLAARAAEEIGDKTTAFNLLVKASNLEPNNILLKSNLARIYFEQKDFKNSIEIFNKIILAYPDNLKARSYLGAALQATDNYMAAIEQYNYVLNYTPDEYSVVKNLGDSWLALKQFEKAKENYQKAQEIDPKVPNIYADIAYLSKQQGDMPNAIANYRKALTLKDNIEWKKSLAYSLLSDKKETEAITIFDEIKEYGISGYVYQSKGDNAKAIESYQKAIEQNPKDHKSRFNLASIYYDKGQLLQAKTEYQNLLEQKPNDAEAMFLLATIKHEEGQIDQAMNFYNQILTQLDANLKPDEEQKALKNNTKFNLALAFKSKSNLVKAEENFQDILKAENKTDKFAKSKDVFKELSFIKIALGKDIEAEKIINDWLREDPTSVEARNLYADFLVHQSKDRQAIEQLRLASVLDKTIITRLKLANLLHSQNNLYEALAEYQTILKEDPNNLSALLGAANNFRTLGFKEEAAAMYKETLNHYPNDLFANYNYGLLMQESKNLDEAKSHYEKVIGLNPNFIQAYYVLGLVYWNQGEKDKAKDYWNKFSSVSSDQNLKDQIKKILDTDETKQISFHQ
ncbi:MAG: tetratricopeptide repeat protein [Candidatus Caenarcaniphilales bacterium]|jgi:superkiller protein 3|nr:tetratricopeptide repeat protein [Candidatus Caenarcaniphilales bacterium]